MLSNCNAKLLKKSIVINKKHNFELLLFFDVNIIEYMESSRFQINMFIRLLIIL